MRGRRQNRDSKREAKSLDSGTDKKKSKSTQREISPASMQMLNNGCFKLAFPSYAEINKFCEMFSVTPLRINKDNSCVIAPDQINLWLGNREGAAFHEACSALEYPEDPDFSIFSKLSRKNADLIARLRLSISDVTVFSFLSGRGQYDVLLTFIELLSSELCCQLALTNVSEGDTYLMDMLKLSKTDINPRDGRQHVDIDLCIQLFLDKLSPEIRNQFAIHQNDFGDTGLSTIAQFCGSTIAADFIRKLSPDTCDRAALMYDTNTQTSCYSDLCYYCPPEIVEQYSAKLSPEVLFKALTTRNNKHISYNNNEYRRSVLEELLTHWDSQQVLYFLNKQLSKSDHRVNLLKFFDLYGITIYDGGGSIDSWTVVTNALLDNSVPVRKRKKQHDMRRSITAVELPELTKKSLFEDATKQGWKFSHLYGRSMVFKNRKGDALVCKVQKKGKGETLTGLADAYKSTKFLGENKQRLKLKSYIPTVVDFAQVDGVTAWVQAHAAQDQERLQTFMEYAGTTFTTHAVFVYKVEAAHQHYFTYLHDVSLSDEVYEQANEAAVHDLFVLLRHGLVFNQLADMFHNLEHTEERNDKGRFVVFATLLRAMRRGGTGRLTGWTKAVEFLNITGEGLIDLGDCISINKLIGSTDYTRHFYDDALYLHDEDSSNYLIANVMAEYQYVLFIAAGRRALTQHTAAKQQRATKDQLYAIWLKHAKQFMKNCAYAVALTTRQPIEEVLAQMNNIVDLHRIAGQMKLWMTTEYIKYIKQDYLPKSVYGESVPVTVLSRHIRRNTFNGIIGFSLDGKTPDLGTVNGQEPLKEANKLLYWMVSFIFKSYKNVSLAVTELNAVVNETNVLKSEKVRKQAFTYLPDKAYHRLQHTLCEERLHSDQQLSRNMRTKLKQESVMHQQTAAALTIQGFWRRRQSEQQGGNKKRRVDIPDLVPRKVK